MVGAGNPENSCRGYRTITQVEKKCGRQGLLNLDGVRDWYDTYYFLTYPKGDPKSPIALEGIYCMEKNDNGFVRYWICFPQQGDTMESYMERNNIKPTPEREEIEITAESGETITAYSDDIWYITADKTMHLYQTYSEDGRTYDFPTNVVDVSGAMGQYLAVLENGEIVYGNSITSATDVGVCGEYIDMFGIYYSILDENGEIHLGIIQPDGSYTDKLITVQLGK